MTSGGGLDAVFDASNTTYGQRTSSSGWCGVDYRGVSAKVDYVEVVSGAAGFNGIRIPGQTTVELRGAVGGKPSVADAGTLLGSATFTNVSAQHTITINSNDTTTYWEYVWIVVKTTAWAVVAKLRIYGTDGSSSGGGGGGVVVAGDSSTLRTVTTADETVRTKALYSVKLNYTSTYLPFSSFVIYVDASRIAHTDVLVTFKHTGKSYDGTVSFIGLANVTLYLKRRSAGTIGGLDSATLVDLVSTTGNIVNFTQQYLTLQLSFTETLPANYHEYSLFAACIASALPLNDSSHKGIVELVPTSISMNQMCTNIKATGSVLST